MTTSPHDWPTQLPAAQTVTTIGCVGLGTIGGGWAAHFLARGYDVHAWDPSPQAESRVKRLIEAAWPALEELGLFEGASPDRITVHTELADALEGWTLCKRAPQRCCP